MKTGYKSPHPLNHFRNKPIITEAVENVNRIHTLSEFRTSNGIQNRFIRKAASMSLLSPENGFPVWPDTSPRLNMHESFDKTHRRHERENHFSEWHLPR